MGTTPVNTALGELHGKIDDYVFRKVEGDTIVARKPRGFKVPPTENQVFVRGRFKLAAEHVRSVRSDPARLQPYLDFAERTGVTRRRLTGMILRDFLIAPTIPDINTANYHRVPGGEIRVTAIDDTLVTAVHVKITRQSDGSIIEQGAATYRGPFWYYTTTATAVAAPEMLEVNVTATDIAGNVGGETMGLRT